MEPTEHDRAAVTLQETVYAALETFNASGRFELCAYLHRSSDQGPQLFLHTPDLAAIAPDQAFTLFTALREALDADVPETSRTIGRFNAVLVSIPEAGLIAAGRTSTLEGHDPGAVRTLAAGLGRLLGAIRGGGRTDGRTIGRITVEAVAGSVRAEVHLEGTQGAVGRGDAASPPRAVATATLDALAYPGKLIEIAEDDLAGEQVVLVLLADELDRRSVGSALAVDGDSLRAAAAATILAARISSSRASHP